MKVSLKWLADYVALPDSVQELADRLTMGGLEVEGIERRGTNLGGVVVAQIKESVPHPNADKLSVTQVDAGSAGTLQIVCGAKNYKVGDKVPLATVGTTLPNGTEIKKASLRGVESSGMLCSARELGLSEDAQGLLILDPSVNVGNPIATELALEDVVFEVNVTPNRADALSHVGIAREVSALTGQPLRLVPSKVSEGGGVAAEKVKIRIDDSARCPRYAGRIIEGVKIGPSPQWMQRRLEACGIRPISNVVDVTNYVMLELGQPLHAFDLDRLHGAEIVVRTPTEGEKIVTLDGKERALHPEDLVICDREKPQAIAGVMGGEHSEVRAGTQRILLESACFQPASVRRTAKRHALHSEASHRFERGTDPNIVPVALDRAADLMAELGGGTVLRGRVDVLPKAIPARKVALRFARVGEVLGTKVGADESQRILSALGFKADKTTPEQVTYEVPSFRVDVDREEDLIEEVARVRGYDAIPAVLPRSSTDLLPEPPMFEAERRIRQAMSGLGFDEVLNFSFVSAKELEALGMPGQVFIQNPLSAEQEVMRTTLLAGLLQNLSRDLRHQVETVRIYELGRVYAAPEPPLSFDRPPAGEVYRAAGLAFGSRYGRTWALKEARADFYDAKAAVEGLADVLGVQGLSFVPTEKPQLHPRTAASIRVGERVVGYVGELHPKVARRLDIPEGVFVFELDVDPLVAKAHLVPSYRPLPRFPAVLRDIAVVVDAHKPASEVGEVIRKTGGALIEEVRLFDVYTGKPIPEGKKNLAFALRYRAPDRTLTDTEVNEAHQKIVAEVTRAFGGTLRAS